MAMLFESNREWFPSEEDELVQRLRALEWPEVRPEVPDRCWQEFSRRISRLESAGATEKTASGPRRAGERYACTRPSVTNERRIVVSQRLAAAQDAARSWSRQQSLKSPLAFA